MPPKEVPLQQEVVHEGHEQQQRCKASSNEGHKVGQVGQSWGGELLEVLLGCLVAGIQPAGGHASIRHHAGMPMALQTVLAVLLVSKEAPCSLPQAFTAFAMGPSDCACSRVGKQQRHPDNLPQAFTVLGVNQVSMHIPASRSTTSHSWEGPQQRNPSQASPPLPPGPFPGTPPLVTIQIYTQRSRCSCWTACELHQVPSSY